MSAMVTMMPTLHSAVHQSAGVAAAVDVLVGVVDEEAVAVTDRVGPFDDVAARVVGDGLSAHGGGVLLGVALAVVE